MHIGILQCDTLRPEHQEHYLSYPDMIKQLLNRHISANTLNFTNYSYWENDFPSSAHASHDAWIITGSKYSCYEQFPWMLQIENLIRSLYIKHVPCIGLCFGHQIIARALGGTVQQSEKGWGIGTTKVTLCKKQPWMIPYKSTMCLFVSHKDQITQCPKNADVLAGNQFCPNFLLQYSQYMIGIQGHPEFGKEYMHALISARTQDHVFDKTTAAAAIASLDAPPDNDIFAQWMLALCAKI